MKNLILPPVLILSMLMIVGCFSKENKPKAKAFLDSKCNDWDYGCQASSAETDVKCLCPRTKVWDEATIYCGQNSCSWKAEPPCNGEFKTRNTTANYTPANTFGEVQTHIETVYVEKEDDWYNDIP